MTAAEAIARAWDASPDASATPAVQAMARAEIARIERAFRTLPYRVSFVTHDPYTGFEHMRDQIRSTGAMLVYTGHSDTPLWAPEVNWLARAVHDHDHMRAGIGFDLAGEAAAFRLSAARVPGLAPLYFSEILAQAAYASTRGRFAPQKIIIAPEAVLRLGGAL